MRVSLFPPEGISDGRLKQERYIEMIRLDGTRFTSPEDYPFGYVGREGFIDLIHPNDNMMSADRADLYFWMGKTALDCIKAVAPDREFRRILDFPSGYGRVLRFLRAAYNDAEIVACEIDPSAVEFCSNNFNALPVVSLEEIDKVQLSGKFDLIWVGSLFTHLDEKSASDLFLIFRSVLSENGLLVFSIAGKTVRDHAANGELGGVSPDVMKAMLAEFDRRGFAFGSYNPGISEQSNYGRAFISEDWLEDKRIQLGGLEGVAYIDRGYSRRQDVIVWRRSVTEA